MQITLKKCIFLHDRPIYFYFRFTNFLKNLFFPRRDFFKKKNDKQLVYSI